MFVFLFYSIIVQSKILATLKKNEVAKIHKILLLIESCCTQASLSSQISKIIKRLYSQRHQTTSGKSGAT